MWKKSSNQTVVLLSPFVLLSALGMDVYLPCVPELAKELGASGLQIQLSLSLYLLFAGIGQLVFGPLADRFGRRPILIASCGLYVLGSLGCAFSGDINLLLVARLIAALGACGAFVGAFAIVRDGFSPAACAHIYSQLNGLIALAPIAAPVLGAYLSIWYSWRACFVFLAVFSALALLVSGLLVDESQVAEETRMAARDWLHDYQAICRHPLFLTYAWSAGAGLAAFFTFFSVSPIVTMEVLGLAKQEFSYTFGGVALFFMLVSFLTPRITAALGLTKAVLLGMLLMTLGGLLMLVWHWGRGVELAGLVLPMLVAITGVGLVLGCSAAVALGPFADMAGKAAAVFGAIQFTVAATVGSLATHEPVDSCLPLAYTLLLTGLLTSLLIAFSHLRGHSCQPTAPSVM